MLALTIYEGVQESSQKMPSDELRRFIAIDNVVAVKVGELMMYRAVKNVAWPPLEQRTLPRGVCS